MDIFEETSRPAELKIFDPLDPSTALPGAELADATVCKRGDRWWMFLAGQAGRHGAPDIFSASLLPRAPLSAKGWKPAFDARNQPVPIATRNNSSPWDGKGGRHCPSYVTGLHPQTGKSVERIYYAGASGNLWGPYAIGFLEWNGNSWDDQPQPAFAANEEWEHGSVYEPNLIYHNGKWKMWYVAGSNAENYLVHGYSESADGVSGWSKHTVFAPPDMKMFDFCVRRHGETFHAVFARVWLKDSAPPPHTGLWWCAADTPSSCLSHWSQPVQIMTAENRGWHSGPWKPSFAFEERSDRRFFVFFDGSYRASDPGPFPFVFTLGCLVASLPGDPIPELEAKSSEPTASS